MNLETLPRRTPEAMFEARMTSQEKEEVFKKFYAPQLKKGERISFLNSGKGANLDWRYENFNPHTGEVTLKTGASEDAKVPETATVSLMQFYLENPDKSPAEMKIPLSFFVKEWDAKAPSDKLKFADEDGLTDEAFDFLENNPQTQEKRLATLVDIKTGRKIIQQWAKREGFNTEDESPAVQRLNNLFGIEEEKMARAA